MRSLFDDIRSEQNIFSAWRHVKRSAISSGNPNIRGYASEFEHSHQRHLKRIISQIREGRFAFDPVEAVLKDKKKRQSENKDPRPIAIATLKNRIVQRAILQVLQPRKERNLRDPNTRFESLIDNRLGRINEVNRSRFGVGGLIRPYGGVQPAISLIMQAMDRGAKYYYQSDIKSFFTRIPTDSVVEFVEAESRDINLTELFSEALDVHLANPDEIKGYAHLFPNGGIGVAQGSSLSAFAGNVLLYDFDHELNGMGVTAVRYIDDILIVADHKAQLEAAIDYATERLSTFGFGLYSPEESRNKAARGTVDQSINFLGCSVQPNRCVPSKASIDRLKNRISSYVTDSRRAISRSLKNDKPIDQKYSYSNVVKSIGDSIFGWQRSFAFCTDIQPFRQIDIYVYNTIKDYNGFIRRHASGSSDSRRMDIFGVPSMAFLFERG